jgi:WD40 repeat protein
MASVPDEVRVFDMATYQEVTALDGQDPTGYPGVLVWSPTGDRLAVTEGETIVIWEYDTTTDHYRQIAALTQSPEYVLWLDWKADRLAGSGADYIIRVWDTDTWEVVNTFQIDGEPKSLFAFALSPDGRTIAFSGEAGRLEIRPVVACSLSTDREQPQG